MYFPVCGYELTKVKKKIMVKCVGDIDLPERVNMHYYRELLFSTR